MLPDEVRTQMDQALAGPLPEDRAQRDEEIRQRIAAAEQIRAAHVQQAAQAAYADLLAAGIPEATARRLSGYEGDPEQ